MRHRVRRKRGRNRIDIVEGTLIYDTADPLNDDNGPGNYAYPTSTAFHDGAFDIEA